jgi:long-subunit fatty acid transport protein
MRKASWRWLLLLGILSPSVGWANAFDQFGFEPRDLAMGGTQTVTGDGHVAAYFNPAMLAMQKEVSVGVGLMYAKPVMDVHTLALNDAPNLHLAGAPPDFDGLTLGVLFPLGGKIGNRVALGLGLYIPTNNILRAEAIDPKLPSWYDYQSSPDRIVVALSAGVRILDWLYVGGGAQVLGAFLGGFQFRVNIFNQEFETRSLKNDLALHAAALAGLALDFQKIGLRFGFSYRSPIYLDYDMPTEFDIADVGLIHISMKGVVHYSPHTFSLGVRWAIGPVIAAAEVRYAMWSRAPDPSVQVGMTIDSNVLTALGADKHFDSASPNEPPGFSDTIEPHIGLEYWIIPRFAVRAGYSFRPTPVPLQDGDTNILDGNTHAFSFGVGFSFDDPLEVFAKPVHIDLAYQLLLVPERTANKASGSDVPSYAYSGKVNNLCAAVRYVF